MDEQCYPLKPFQGYPEPNPHWAGVYGGKRLHAGEIEIVNGSAVWHLSTQSDDRNAFCKRVPLAGHVALYRNVETQMRNYGVYRVPNTVQLCTALVPSSDMSTLFPVLDSDHQCHARVTVIVYPALGLVAVEILAQRYAIVQPDTFDRRPGWDRRPHLPDGRMLAASPTASAAFSAWFESVKGELRFIEDNDTAARAVLTWHAMARAEVPF